MIKLPCNETKQKVIKGKKIEGEEEQNSKQADEFYRVSTFVLLLGALEVAKVAGRGRCYDEAQSPGEGLDRGRWQKGQARTVETVQHPMQTPRVPRDKAAKPGEAHPPVPAGGLGVAGADLGVVDPHETEVLHHPVPQAPEGDHQDHAVEIVVRKGKDGAED